MNPPARALFQLTSSHFISPRTRRIGLYATLAAVSAFAYVPTLNNGFLILDDYNWIERVYSLSIPQFFSTAFTLQNYGSNYRPLISVIFYINYQLFGLNPFGYHLVSLLFQIANVLLIASIVRFVTQRDLPALFAGLVFATYPLYSESVLWIAAYPEMSAAFFLLAALRVWLGYLKTGKPSRYWGALALTLLALLSKETGLALVPLFILTDWLLVPSKRDLQSRLRRYVPLGLLIGAYLLVAYLVYTQLP
ncbi:MAG TPA: glycosyltransferase family 39 protein, partial [Anaerolineae bacterium]|nr:glycosyltransferase family 39 protein [Anaerolineae bacterium]